MGDEGAVAGGLPLGRLDDRLDGQVVALREGVVPLVVGRDGHDRARPVLHQHVVGDPDRPPRVVDRVADEAAREDAGLLAVRG